MSKILKRLALIMLPFLALGVFQSAVRADVGTTVTFGRTTGRNFAGTVDGPVSVYIQSSESLNATGGCTVLRVGIVAPHHSPAIVGVTCTGPGTFYGNTFTYRLTDCVGGELIAQDLIVSTDDGRIIFDDTDLGPCEASTTTSTITTTTIPAPTTTVIIPNCRRVLKPFPHCLSY